MRFYFVVTNKMEMQCLEDVGARNALVSYAFLRKTPSMLEYLHDCCDRVIMDSGAFTAYTTGKAIDFDEYNEYAIANRELYTDAWQLDVIGNVPATVENYKRHVNEGAEWINPVLAGNPMSTLELVKPYLKSDYVGFPIASSVRKHKGKSLWNLVRAIAGKYRVHALAGGTVEAIRHRWMYSTDSSRWAEASIHNIGSFWDHGDVRQFFTRLRSKHQHALLKRALTLHAKDVADCDINPYLVNMSDLCKLDMALFYRPMFRQLGRGLYEENFKW